MRTSFLLIAALSLAALVAQAEEAKPKVAAKAPRTITMSVTDKGYEPGKISLKKGEPVKFVITRKTDETCATDLLIEGTSIKVALPLNKPVEVAWTPEKSGQVKFGCAMGMMISGVMLVE